MFKKFTSLSLFVVVCLLSSVCFGQSEDWKNTLHGKWKCDLEKTTEMMKAAGTEQTEIDMMKDMLGAMSMEIAEDHMVMSMSGQVSKVTYTVEDSNEKKQWIKVKVLMEGQPEPKRGEFTILGDDSLKLVADDGTKLVFARVKEEEKKEDDG